MRRGTKRSVVSWIKRRPIAGAPIAKATEAAVREAYLAQRVRGAPDRDRGAEGGDGHARWRERRVSRARCEGASGARKRMMRWQ